jgi:hypothetical protein
MSQMSEGVFERCNEIARTSLALTSFYEWICEMKRLHNAGRTLPAVPLIEFAFSMDRVLFEEHENAICLSSIQFDCAQTHAELEHAGILAPVLNDTLLRVYLERTISTDAEVRQHIDHMSNRKRVAHGQ